MKALVLMGAMLLCVVGCGPHIAFVSSPSNVSNAKGGNLAEVAVPDSSTSAWFVQATVKVKNLGTRVLVVNTYRLELRLPNGQPAATATRNSTWTDQPKGLVAGQTGQFRVQFKSTFDLRTVASLVLDVSTALDDESHLQVVGGEIPLARVREK
jgi:hypothetical protein